MGYLRNFLVNNVEGAPDLETLIKEAASGNTEPLEHHIEKFFTGYRVTDKKTGQLLLPKKGTKDCYMSHLKVINNNLCLSPDSRPTNANLGVYLSSIMPPLTNGLKCRDARLLCSKI